MVRVNNESGEKDREKRRYDLICRLAQDIFDDVTVTASQRDWFDDIGGRKISVDEGYVRIDCYFKEISVRDEEYYLNSLKLAKQCEKKLGEEFTLKIEYHKSHMDDGWI